MSARSSDLFDPRIALGDACTRESMRVARQFALELRDAGLLGRAVCVKCELNWPRGGAGRRGEGTDAAVLLALEGEEVERLPLAAIATRLRRIHDKRELRVLGTRRIAFDRRHHLAWPCRDSLPSDREGMRLSAFDAAGALLHEKSGAWNPGADGDRREIRPRP